jgi:hypothetical protein
MTDLGCYKEIKCPFYTLKKDFYCPMEGNAAGLTRFILCDASGFITKIDLTLAGVGEYNGIVSSAIGGKSITFFFFVCHSTEI